MHIQTQQMATCPFNKAHTFARSKFIFHIQRCKDKQKVIHLYKKCQFNPLHFVLKEEIEIHQCCCPSREESLEILKRHQQAYRKALREPRQRSRQRQSHKAVDNKLQEKDPDNQNVKNQFCCDETILEECEDCQDILRKYKARIMSSTNENLKKFILKYYDLQKEISIS